MIKNDKEKWMNNKWNNEKCIEIRKRKRKRKEEKNWKKRLKRKIGRIWEGKGGGNVVNFLKGN